MAGRAAEVEEFLSADTPIGESDSRNTSILAGGGHSITIAGDHASPPRSGVLGFALGEKVANPVVASTTPTRTRTGGRAVPGRAGRGFTGFFICFIL